MVQNMIKQSVNGARGDGVLVIQDEHKPIRQIVDLVDEDRAQPRSIELGVQEMGYSGVAHEAGGLSPTRCGWI